MKYLCKLKMNNNLLLNYYALHLYGQNNFVQSLKLNYFTDEIITSLRSTFKTIKNHIYMLTIYFAT